MGASCLEGVNRDGPRGLAALAVGSDGNGRGMTGLNSTGFEGAYSPCP